MKLTRLPKYSELTASVQEISPSTYAYISENCAFPAVVKTAVRERLFPLKVCIPSLVSASYLGTIIHNLYEERVKGKIPDEDTYIRKWEQQIEYYNQKLTADYCTLRNIDIEDYDKMYESCRSVLEVHVSEGTTGSSNHQSNVKLEETISYPNLLKGKADLLRFSPNGIEVVDYKSGKIFEDDGQLKESIVLQLNLYAICCEHQYGKPVTKLTVISTVDNSEIDIPLRKNKHEDYIESIKSLQKRINDAIKAQSLEQLQKVEPSRCRFCDCRHMCTSYLSFDATDKFLVYGEVVNYMKPKSLKLKTDDGKEISIVKLDDITFDESIEGKKLVFVNVVSSIEGIYKRTDSTLIFEKAE